MASPQRRSRAAPAARPAPRPVANHAIHGRQRRGFTDKSFTHMHHGEDIDPYLTADVTLMKQISDVLERHYPCHPWMVKVTHKQGVAMIKLPILMGRNDEYVLHINRLKGDPGLRAVVRAGGELLERYNVPRQAFSIDHFLSARALTPMGRPRIVKPERPKLLIPG